MLAAHPNIRLFVTQGGLQSFNEAVNNEVPMIGIPFIGDQKHNVAKLVSAGVGLKIDFKSLTKETVLETFNTVLKNPRQVVLNQGRFIHLYKVHDEYKSLTQRHSILDSPISGRRIDRKSVV